MMREVGLQVQHSWQQHLPQHDDEIQEVRFNSNSNIIFNSIMMRGRNQVQKQQHLHLQQNDDEWKELNALFLPSLLYMTPSSIFVAPSSMYIAPNSMCVVPSQQHERQLSKPQLQYNVQEDYLKHFLKFNDISRYLQQIFYFQRNFKKIASSFPLMIL